MQVAGPRLMCLWRTELGFLDHCFSDDFGSTWNHNGSPRPMLYDEGATSSV